MVRLDRLRCAAAVAVTMCLIAQVTPGRSAASCDREFSEVEGFLVSDNYPFNYRPNLTCTYTFNFNKSYNVLCLRFHRFQLTPPSDVLTIRGRPLRKVLQEQNYMFDPIDGSLMQIKSSSRPPDGHRIEPTSINNYTGFGDDPNPAGSLWQEGFCWLPEASYGIYSGTIYPKSYGTSIVLTFTSRSSNTNTGFFAEYRLLQFNRNSDIWKEWQGGKQLEHTPPCSGKAVCFDRSCSRRPYIPRCDREAHCQDESDVTFVHSRCLNNSVPVQRRGQMACDFGRQDLQDTSPADPPCQQFWQDEGILEYPVGSSDRNFGPRRDHSNTVNGRYAMMSFRNKRESSHTVLLWNGWPFLGGSVRERCLSFWYHMNGNGVGQLHVHDGSPNRPDSYIWSRHGSYGDRWLHAYISISSWFPVRFVFKRGVSELAQIALDDVSFTDGPCPYTGDISCTFGEGRCGWSTIDVKQSSLMPHDFSTVSSSKGRFLTATCEGDSCKTQLIFKSPPLTSPGPGCLIMNYRFWYPGEESLDVELRAFDGGRVDSFRVDGNGLHYDQILWHQSKFHIRTTSSGVYIKVRFRCERSRIDIDDIQFLPGACRHIESGSCSWGRIPCKTTSCLRDSTACGDDYGDGQPHTPRSGQSSCSDENPSDAPSSVSSVNPMVIVSVVVGAVLVAAIICIKIALLTYRWCSRRRERRRRRRVRRRMEALREIHGENNTGENDRPPRYFDIVGHDNVGFRHDEGVHNESDYDDDDDDDDDSKQGLPKYSDVIDSGMLTITIPVASEIERLRKAVQEQSSQSSLPQEAERAEEPQRPQMVGGVASEVPEGEVQQNQDQQQQQQSEQQPQPQLQHQQLGHETHSESDSEEQGGQPQQAEATLQAGDTPHPVGGTDQQQPPVRSETPDQPPPGTEAGGETPHREAPSEAPGDSREATPVEYNARDQHLHISDPGRPEAPQRVRLYLEADNRAFELDI